MMFRPVFQSAMFRRRQGGNGFGQPRIEAHVVLEKIHVSGFYGAGTGYPVVGVKPLRIFRVRAEIIFYKL
jgi:hypothetical protein